MPGTSDRQRFERNRHGWWLVLGALSGAGLLGGWRWLAFSTMLVLADQVLRSWSTKRAASALQARRD